MIVKPEIKDAAVKTFHDTEVEIVERSRAYGSVLGSQNACRKHQEHVAHDHTTLLRKLADHSKNSLQKVYKSLTDALQHKLTFLSRITPDIDNVLQETEIIIAKELIPNLAKQPSDDSIHRKTLALQVKHGGLNILCPDKRVDHYKRSKTVCGSQPHGDLSTVKIDQRVERSTT